MPAPRGLNANLIALAGLEPYFDERRVRERFDDAIGADRLHRAWIANARGFCINIF
jgi:hypothetical protein